MENNNIEEKKKVAKKSTTSAKTATTKRVESKIESNKAVNTRSNPDRNNTEKKTKKKRCSYLWIYAFIIIVAVVIASTFLFRAEKFTMNFNNMDSVQTVVVSYSQGEPDLVINNDLMIYDIVSFIKKVNYETKIESVSDEPNVEIYYKINLKTQNTESVVYIYERDGKKYIEQPYNGIYEVSDEIYDVIYSRIVV